MSRHWHIAFTLSGEEEQAGKWLTARADAAETFFPSDVHWRRGPRHGRNKPKKWPVLKACVPGYLFVRFHYWPQHAWVKDNCPHVYGWMQIGDKPVLITQGVMLEMKQVPERLAEMKERLRQAEIEARTFRKGDRAIIEDGPLEGWQVQVVSATGDMVLFDTVLGVGRISHEHIRKVS